MAWLSSIRRRLAARRAAPLPESAAAACYAAIVAQARQPAFYAALQVPDTPQGRFEMVLLHACLALRRLSGEPAFGQALFDLMFADFDVNLRELGVGDLGVGKRVYGWAAAFRGRAATYAAGLIGEIDLAAALARNVYASRPEADPAPLADYVRRAAAALALYAPEAVMAGALAWPSVDETMKAAA